MTRSEREHIIQRYLSGEMSSAEEGDFFIQVALDRELRHDLQAQQTIESAFRKEREAERVGHTALRTRVASMLAAGPPPAPSSEPVTAPAEMPAPPAAAPLPPSPALPEVVARNGGSLLGWSALAVCAVVAVIALLLADPFGGKGTPSPAPAPAASPAESGAGSGSSMQRRDIPGDVSTPGGSPAIQEGPSSPAITPSTRPRRTATQERASTASPRSDLRARSTTTRTAPLPSHDATEHDATTEEGARNGGASGKMKVGVRVKIKPQQ